MSSEISNGDLFDSTFANGDWSNKSIKLGEKFKRLAELLISGNGLKTNIFKLQVILRLVYDLRNKDEKWRQKKKSFKCDDQLKRNRVPSCSLPVLPPKCGRKSVALADTPCQRVQSKILKTGLCKAASFNQEHGIEKEVMLQKLAEEAVHSREWDMPLFLENLRGRCQIPIPELTSLIYVANLSQRQYQICRNLLLKYNVTAFEPR